MLQHQHVCERKEVPDCRADGAGRTELAMSVFGRSYERIYRGTADEWETHTGPGNAGGHQEMGLPRSKKPPCIWDDTGQSITNNITLPSLGNFVDRAPLTAIRRWWLQMNTGKLSIKCYNVEQDVSKLSGGNQQKVIFSKWYWQVRTC